MQAAWKTLTLAAALGLGSTLAVAPGAAQLNNGQEPSKRCPYGYFNYDPYSCAPYGYYGPEWFDAMGHFYGAGQWFHGPKGFQPTVHKEYDPLFGYKGKLPKEGDPRTEPVDAAHFHPAPPPQG